MYKYEYDYIIPINILYLLYYQLLCFIHNYILLISIKVKLCDLVYYSLTTKYIDILY